MTGPFDDLAIFDPLKCGSKQGYWRHFWMTLSTTYDCFTWFLSCYLTSEKPEMKNVQS